MPSRPRHGHRRAVGNGQIDARRPRETPLGQQGAAAPSISGSGATRHRGSPGWIPRRWWQAGRPSGAGCRAPPGRSGPWRAATPAAPPSTARAAAVPVGTAALSGAASRSTSDRPLAGPDTCRREAGLRPARPTLSATGRAVEPGRRSARPAIRGADAAMSASTRPVASTVAQPAGQALRRRLRHRRDRCPLGHLDDDRHRPGPPDPGAAQVGHRVEARRQPAGVDLDEGPRVAQPGYRQHLGPGDGADGGDPDMPERHQPRGVERPHRPRHHQNGRARGGQDPQPPAALLAADLDQPAGEAGIDRQAAGQTRTGQTRPARPDAPTAPQTRAVADPSLAEWFRGPLILTLH